LGENGLASDTAEALLASSPSLKNRILRTAGETGVNELAKPVQIMNTLNVAQDAFFRKVIFTASVEKQLSRVGLNMYDVMAEGKNVPFDVLKNATDEALAIMSGILESFVSKGLVGMLPTALALAMDKSNQVVFIDTSLSEDSPCTYILIISPVERGIIIEGNVIPFIPLFT